MSAAQEVISRFMAVFGEPKTPDPDAFVKEYEKALTGYDKRFLDAAADRLIRRSTFWPKPAEVIAEAGSISTEFYERKDWEAIEKERREGWKLSDLNKVAVDAAAKARVQAMVDRLKATFEAARLDAVDDVEWPRGQRDGFEDMQRTSPSRMHRA